MASLVGGELPRLRARYRLTEGQDAGHSCAAALIGMTLGERMGLDAARSSALRGAAQGLGCSTNSSRTAGLLPPTTSRADQAHRSIRAATVRWAARIVGREDPGPSAAPAADARQRERDRRRLHPAAWSAARRSPRLGSRRTARDLPPTSTGTAAASRSAAAATRSRCSRIAVAQRLDREREPAPPARAARVAVARLRGGRPARRWSPTASDRDAREHGRHEREQRRSVRPDAEPHDDPEHGDRARS